MTYVSTLSENIDVGTAQFLWERNSFQSDVTEKLEAYTERLRQEKLADNTNESITRAIQVCLCQYKWILKQEINTEEKLDFMRWLFNSGKLRSKHELQIRLELEERKEQAHRNFFIKNKRAYKNAQLRNALVCMAIFIFLPAVVSCAVAGMAGLSAFLGLGAVPCLLLFSGAIAFTMYSVDKEFGYDASVMPEHMSLPSEICFAKDLRSYLEPPNV